MKTKEAIEYFGTAFAMARALGLQPPVVYRWGEEPPPLRQFQIARATGDALKVEPKYLPAYCARQGAKVPQPAHGILRAEPPAPRPIPAPVVVRQKRKAHPMSLLDLMAANNGVE